MPVTAILPLPAWIGGCPETVLGPVAGRAPVLRVVDGLAPAGDVVIAVAGCLVDSVREVLGAQPVGVRVVAAEPAAGRAQCIATALAASPAGPLLLHDIEWPVVGAAVVDRVVTALQRGALAVLPVVPVTDSVKAVDARGVVTATLDRAGLRSVQYPRGFAAETLAGLLSGGDGEFDELESLLSSRTPTTVVDGDAEALHVALPRDAAYLSALLQARENPSAP